MIKVFACFLLGCVVLTLGARQKRLGNGRKVTESELRDKFPFMVLVKICHREYPRTGCGYCTGSLVKPDRVLVAAHCYCNKGRYAITTVYTGALKSGSRRARRTDGWRITRGMPGTRCGWSLHDNVGLDIALINLAINLDVPTVPLFCKKNGWLTVVFLVDGVTKTKRFPHFAVPLGSKVWLLGYGHDQNNTWGTLRFGTKRTAECPFAYQSQKNIFCTINYYQEPTLLEGDSGGPLLIKREGKFFQIGVASAGHLLARRPGEYTNNIWANVSPLCKAIHSARDSGRRK